MTGSLREEADNRAEQNRLPSINLLGVPIHAITEEECNRHIVTELAAGRGGWVATANLDHLRRLQHDTEFKRIYASASLRVPDGVPLLWASRLQGTALPGQVAGSNLISSLSRVAAESKASIYLLGGDPGTSEKAAEILSARFPGLRIAGTDCPAPGFEQDAQRLAELERALVTAKPDIIFVALGSPKQERIIDSMHSILPGAWWLGVGISFSFLCGDVQRAPRWMQRVGLEWLHRLFQEPRRLMKRYLLQGIPFAMRLFATCTWQRLRGPRPETGI